MQKRVIVNSFRKLIIYNENFTVINLICAKLDTEFVYTVHFSNYIPILSKNKNFQD